MSTVPLNDCCGWSLNWLEPVCTAKANLPLLPDSGSVDVSSRIRDSDFLIRDSDFLIRDSDFLIRESCLNFFMWNVLQFV